MTKTLDALRHQIDQIDQQLLTLLNERSKQVLEIGKIKKQQQQPIYRADREKALLEQLTNNNSGPLPDEALCRIYQALLVEMRSLQEQQC